MSFARLHQRAAAWLMAMLLLAGALLPTLSHAVVGQLVRQGAVAQGWVEVCTVSGMAWVKVAEPALGATAQTPDAATAIADDAAAQPAPASSSGSMAGCDWCQTHAPVAVGLPAPVVQWQPADPQVSIPLAFLHADRTSHVWLSSHSRAPPLSLI